MSKLPEDVEVRLATHEPEIAELARGLCVRIGRLLSDPVITVDHDHIGFGFDTGYKGLVFTVAPAKKHVTLGISHGATLADPAGLMEGAGKVHKHVKVRTKADADRPELHELMSAAVAHRLP